MVRLHPKYSVTFFTTLLVFTALVLLMAVKSSVVKADGTADVSLKEVTDNSTFTVGSNLVYTFVVVNNGPDTATGISLDNTIQDEVTFVSAQSGQGTCTPAAGSVSCTLNDLPAGAYESITLTVRGNTAGQITNIASLSADESDFNLPNNSASKNILLTDPNNANPSLTVGAPVVQVNEGQTVQNNGTLVNPLLTGGQLTASIGTITPSVTGAGGAWQWSYTADFDAPLNKTVMITSSDAVGRKTQTSFEVIINNINRPPVVVNDSASSKQGTAVFVSVLANDSDPDDNTLTIGGIATQPANGIAAIDPNDPNVIIYGPNPGFNGTDSFTYTASDGQGGQGQATVTVIVTAAGLPDNAPTARTDTFGTFKNIPLVLTDSQVLANDVDADDPVLTVTGASVASPAGASVVFNPDSTITITPPSNFTGTVTGNYTISDGRGGTSGGTISVLVIQPTTVNQPPTAVDDLITTHVNQSVIFWPSDLLRNDSDPNGDVLTITSIVPWSYYTGWVTVNANGSITYTPHYNDVGIHHATYTISDGNGGTATATVVFSVS